VKKKKMKKMGIMLAALVITMFFVGSVAAMAANNPPDQREKFREDSAVQGSGYVEYDKIVLDKEIAVDVEEHMWGDTGNGSFAMTITEILNEGVRLNCTGNCSDMGLVMDPIRGGDHSPVMINFESKKMVQFEIGDSNPLNPAYRLNGIATYNNPGFYGGMNAQVTERYEVMELQKDELVTMTTTATYNDIPRDWSDCSTAVPYNANALNFDTKNAFVGMWGTDSSWKQVCNKNVQHHQFFSGEFQVDKNLMFTEEVTKPCPEKEEPHGDC
jgi:hypothetical protein